MSRSLRRTRALRLLLTGALAGTALIGVNVSAANASFTTGKCLGDPVVSQGASFAKNAQLNVFIPQALPSFCEDAGTVPSVSYTSTGSGAGRRVMGERSSTNADGSQSRNQPERFSGTDEPVKPAGQQQINDGTDAVGDEGLMHLIPVAAGSIAIPVNLPDGCTILKQADGTALTVAQQGQLSDPGTPDKARLQLTRDQIEKVFNGGSEFDTWGKLLPWINDGNNTAGQPADTRCVNFPLVRVVRNDDSGTTFNIKDYLDQLNPSRGWISTFGASPNTSWPNQTKTVAFDYNNNGTATNLEGVPKCARQQGASPITSCTEDAVPTLQTTEVIGGSGGGAVVNKVFDFDGSIGYADLATVRQAKAFAFVRDTTPGNSDDKYWAKVQNKAQNAFVDPALGTTGFTSTAATGASCVSASARNVPTGTDPTLGNWAATSVADTTANGYGVCTVTYAIAFDDYSGPYSAAASQTAEERKARTVRDHLEAATTVGQSLLAGQDYAPLPTSLLAAAQTGVQAIGWGKTVVIPPPPTCPAGQVGTPPNCTTPQTPTCPAGQVGTPPNCTVSLVKLPPVIPPNKFTITSARVSSGKIVLSVKVPGKGAVRASGSATYKKKKYSVGSSASTTKAGATVKLTLKPSSKAVSVLKKTSLKVTASVTYSPTGGTENTQKKTVTIKKTKAKKKKHSKKKKKH